MLVALMLRTGIPFDVWLRQPDGVIETTLRLIHDEEAAEQDSSDGKTVYSG